MALKYPAEQAAKSKQRLGFPKSQPEANPSTKRIHPVLELQRALGNRRVAELIRAKRLSPQGNILPLRPSLTIAATHDRNDKRAEEVQQPVAQLHQQPAKGHVQQLVQRDTLLRSPTDDLTHSPNLKFHPQEVRLPGTTIGITASTPCRIENPQDQPIVLDDLESDNSAFKIDLKSNAIPAHGQLAFEIGFTPRAEGQAEALVTASLPIGPVAYLRVHGTGLSPKPEPSAGQLPGDPRYNPMNPLVPPAPEPGDPRYIPQVYGPAFKPPAPEPAKPAAPKLAPPPKPVALAQLKPLVTSPASLEFAATLNHDPVKKPLRLENPNDVGVNVDVRMDFNAQGATFFVENPFQVIGPHQVLEVPVSVVFLPGTLGKTEATVLISESSTDHAPHVQTIRVKGTAQEEKPPADQPAIPDLPPFGSKSWEQARAQLQHSKNAAANIEREYKLWVPNEKEVADKLVEKYVKSVTDFQKSLQTLLTEDTVRHLESLRPDNLESILSFLADFPLAFVPPAAGIAKDALFLIATIRENNETNSKITEAIKSAQVKGVAVSTAITTLTDKAVREMSVGSKIMAHGEGEWDRMVKGEMKNFVDEEQELEKSPGNAQNIKRAKEVYEKGASMMTSFRSAQTEFSQGLRYIAERSTRIDGELAKTYQQIEALVNGPANAPASGTFTLEMTIAQDGPGLEEVRRVIESNDIEVTSVETTPWQAVSLYERRRTIVLKMKAEETKNLNLQGVIRRATKSLQNRQGVMTLNFK